MDKTELVAKAAHLFAISGHIVHTSIVINHREIDIRAEETQGLTRKVILVECADYARPVGVDKLQSDLNKLRAAQESLKDRAIIMHLSKNGYSSQASGYAMDQGIFICTLDSLTHRLINFDAYVEAIKNDKLRPIILREYQPSKLRFDRSPKALAQGGLSFIKEWIKSDKTWLTLLGDYGVGKSWLLKRLLYDLTDDYEKDPTHTPLAFFIPLQKFPKSFDSKTLILKMFDTYGLSGIHYEAFQYLSNTGRIIFLLDSFDEMAQHLNASTIRENLNELLSGLSKNSKAIMTSRPNYFESKAERFLIVEQDGALQWHPLDEKEFLRQNILARTISSGLESSQFARLEDLTPQQRKKLFKIVLKGKPAAYSKLMDLFTRFQELDGISHRAVIARLLTAVAETLATEEITETVEGTPLLPSDLEKLNQGRIFSIVITNLLYRDQAISSVTAMDRLRFLRSFAVYLQSKRGDVFAAPNEIRSLVRELFSDRADSRRQSGTAIGELL